jgi:hypothetical protein
MRYSLSVAAASIKRRSFQYVRWCVLIATLIVIAAVSLRIQLITSVDYFRTALAEAHTDESVIISGQTYRVTDGLIIGTDVRAYSAMEFRVLSLAYRKILTERNPLFALPGVDPVSFSTTITALRDSRDAFTKDQAHARDSNLVQRALYPISFLSAANELEAARLAFIQSGSSEDARTYERDQVRTAAAYTSNLAQFGEAFRILVPAGSGSYATGNVIVGRDDILHAINILMRGARVVEWNAFKRGLCVRGITFVCDRADIAMPFVAASITPPLSSQQSELLARVRGQYELVRTETGRKPLDPRVSPVQLSASVCIKERPGAGPVFTIGSFAQETDTVSELRDISRGIYVGDIIFVRTTANARLPFYNYFEEHGIPYVWTDPMTYYECPQLQRDESIIFSTANIVAFTKRERLSTYASGSDAIVLSGIERRFAATGSILSEADARQYLDIARTLILEDKVPQYIKKIYTTLALPLSDGTAGLDESIHMVAFIDTSNRHVAQRGINFDSSARNLFFVRNAFALLFMENNPSMTGEHENLFPLNDLPATAQPYVYYSDMPDTSEAQDEVFRDMEFYHRMHI